MGRSSAVIAFIACAFGVGGYFLQRPTIASGDVLGDVLVETNPQRIKQMRCDKDIPVGAGGAHFACEVVFQTGEFGRMVFDMDREGMIHPAGSHRDQNIKRSSDPWDN